jgi:membrane-bound metal-dependent hydrolase YbcI (DUF457 family)
LGYILAKTSSKVLRVKINLPLIFLLSILPDIDLLIPGLNHRGPTHSIIITTAIFVLFFVYYRTQAAPFYVAIMQHGLIGDYLSGGGIQLLWPLTTGFYGLNLALVSQTSVSIELVSFVVAIAVLFITKDMAVLFKSKKENIVLLLPEAAILGSIYISLETGLSWELLAVHFLFFAVFAVSVLVGLKGTFLACSDDCDIEAEVGDSLYRG